MRSNLTTFLFISILWICQCSTLDQNVFRDYNINGSCGLQIGNYSIKKISDTEINLLNERCENEYSVSDKDSKKFLAMSFSSDQTEFIAFWSTGRNRITVWTLFERCTDKPCKPRLFLKTSYDSDIGEDIKAIYLDYVNGLVTGLGESGKIYFWRTENGNISSKHIESPVIKLDGNLFIKTVKENDNDFVVIKSDKGVYYHKISFEKIKETDFIIFPIHWTIFFNRWKQVETK